MSDEPARVGWLQQVQRRGVLRVAGSYGAIAWLLLQIGDTVAGPLDWPAWVMKALIVTAVLGFPIACGLAWFLEITPGGIAVDRDSPGARRPGALGLRRYADVIVIGVLLAVVGYLVARDPDVLGVQVRPNLGRSRDDEVLALGIAESVLHQLSNLKQLDVISRTSSFALGEGKGDARKIGERLQATYLLEGSVQSDGRRMRVTTQLIDTHTGADVWSMRFDRVTNDVFAIQDEIALQVTRALELVLDEAAVERMQGQGTEDVDAYLAYLQGRHLLASNRVGDVRQSLGHFERALAADPKFGNAYVAMAEAGLFLAEYDVTEDRDERFRRALEDGLALVNRALVLDASNGEAYLSRAAMTAYSNLAAAEQDYRRGLELAPNAAKGHAGLAAVIYESPERRVEVLELLEHARKLDPLEPAYAVQVAVFQLYEQGDVRSATATLRQVVRSHPDYQPALIRLAKVHRYNLGETAQAVELAERALDLDPGSEDARRGLSSTYLDLGYDAIAEAVLDEQDTVLGLRRIPILLFRHQFLEAGEAAYEAIEQGVVIPEERLLVVGAIRLHARLSRDFERARLTLQGISGVEWGPDGGAELAQRPDLRDVEIGLADVLLQSGRTREGTALLQALIELYENEVGRQGRSELWYRYTFPVAFVLQGDRQRALAMLQRFVDSRQAMAHWSFTFDCDPTLAVLKGDARFQAMRADVLARIAEQKRRYERMVAEARIVDRDPAAAR
jgi:TolB-like protein/Tfp pilus assembly protein PilF